MARLANLFYGVYPHPELQLPDAAVEAAAAHRYVTDRLCRIGMSPAARRALIDAKLSASTAEALYSRADAETLAYAVLTRNESRQGCLEQILHRGQPGAAAQRKLTGRKLSGSVASRLIATGLTAEAAERLLAKELGEVDKTWLGYLAVQHLDTLSLSALTRALNQTVNLSTLPLGAHALERRDDLRAAVLAAATRGQLTHLTVAAAAMRLTADEQRTLTAALTAVGDRDPHSTVHLAYTAACCLADRPTTLVELRTPLLERLAAWERTTAFSAAYGLPTATLWPEVTTLAELDDRDAELLLQRPLTATWAVSARDVQLLELAEHPSYATRLRPAALGALGDAQRYGRGDVLCALLAPLLDDPEPAAPEARTAGDARHLARNVERSVAQLARLVAAATAAESCDGFTLDPASETVWQGGQAPVLDDPAALEAAGTIELKVFDRFYGGEAANAATPALSYLMARLGENRAAWTVALTTMDQLDATVGQLAATALAAAGAE